MTDLGQSTTVLRSPWRTAPGSREAIEQGCICPRMDNARGRGYLGGVKDDDGCTIFVVVVGCPQHSPKDRP